METQCSYCQMNTARQHEYDCPMNPQKQNLQSSPMPCKQCEVLINRINTALKWREIHDMRIGGIGFQMANILQGQPADG